MDWSCVDYCDGFISCSDSHSVGTHSLQRMHCWASGVMLHWMAWVWIDFQQIFIFGRHLLFNDPFITIPGRPETRTHDLWVTSLTLYPLGHDCPKCFIMFCMKHLFCAVESRLWGLCNYSNKGNMNYTVTIHHVFSSALSELCPNRLLR